MARFIRLILFGALGFSFSIAKAFSEEIKPAGKTVSVSASKVGSSSSKSETSASSTSEALTPSKAEPSDSVSSESKNSGRVTSAATESPSDPVPDLVTTIRLLELKVLGVAPDSESIEDRLIAMEQKLFGKNLPGSLFERLIQIRQALTASEASVNKVSGSTSTNPAPSTVPPVGKTPPVVASAKFKKANLPSAGLSRGEQLYEARKLFDDKNYKGARKAMETFIIRNPLVYNGYYLLGLIDLKEHEPSPEYNQFAYNQFLKAYNLAPKSPDCEFVCRYVAQVVNSQRPPDPRSVAVSAKNSPVQALLNVGVNCFLRNDDLDARDLFEFIVKYCPSGAASADYNLGAMAEKHGQLQPALALYRTALTASYDRDALVAYKMLQRRDIDELSAKLIRRSIQRIQLKIKANDRTWIGNEQEKGTRVSNRCTINRLSQTDVWADIIDAGDNRMQ